MHCSNLSGWNYNNLLHSDPFSTRPHQSAFWYNNSWLGFVKKILIMYQKKEENFSAKNEPSFVTVNVAMAHRNYVRRNNLWILKLATYIQRLKITILGANWQLFRLERIAKCSYFILSTQNMKFYWFVMKRKKFLLPIWWYNRGLFPLGNKIFWGLHSEWEIHSIISNNKYIHTKRKGRLLVRCHCVVYTWRSVVWNWAADSKPFPTPSSPPPPKKKKIVLFQLSGQLSFFKSHLVYRWKGASHKAIGLRMIKQIF